MSAGHLLLPYSLNYYVIRFRLLLLVMHVCLTISAVGQRYRTRTRAIFPLVGGCAGHRISAGAVMLRDFFPLLFSVAESAAARILVY